VLLQSACKAAYNRNFPRSTNNNSLLFSLESALDKSGSEEGTLYMRTVSSV
jgi:hypothetical protein